MKKDIPHHKLISNLSNNRFCIPVSLEHTTRSFWFISTGATLNIPVQDYYSFDFLEKLFADRAVLDMPFHLFWLYVNVI